MIHKNFPLDKVIKKDLESALEVKFPSDINKVLDTFKNTNNSVDENFREALSLAERLKDPEVLWLLGKYCEETFMI